MAYGNWSSKQNEFHSSFSLCIVRCVGVAAPHQTTIEWNRIGINACRHVYVLMQSLGSSVSLDCSVPNPAPFFFSNSSRYKDVCLP